MSDIPTPPFINQANCACGGVLVLSHTDDQNQMHWKCGGCGTVRIAQNTKRGAKADAEYQKYLRSTDAML